MPDWESRFRRNLNDVKRGVKNLKKMGLNIRIHETETMTGAIVYHAYVIDRVGNRVCLQKHLFTLNEEEVISGGEPCAS